MATITEITVHASTGFNHPFEQYSNFKPGITLRASVCDEDVFTEIVATLQKAAHEQCMKEKERILAEITHTNAVKNLEDCITVIQRDVDRIIEELAMSQEQVDAFPDSWDKDRIINERQNPGCLLDVKKQLAEKQDELRQLEASTSPAGEPFVKKKEADENAIKHWLILFWNPPDNDWWEFTGTKQQATDEATGERRHHNYGRQGYSLIQLDEPLTNIDPKTSPVGEL